MSNLLIFLRSRVRHSLIGLLFFAAVLSSIAGCGSVGVKPAAGGKVVDAGGMQKTYHAAAAKLELPPGFEFPDKANTGGASGFEDGVGVQNAQTYWIIAWETEWLEQQGKDESRARKALDVLKNEVPKSWSMTKGSDQSVRNAYAEFLKKAELGDPSGFQGDVELNGLEMKRVPE